MADASGRSGSAVPGSSNAPTKRKKTHRGTKGKRKKDRRKSFAVHTDDINQDEPATAGPLPSSFYAQDRNLSGTSLDSEALLDHRDQPRIMRPRRSSTVTQMHNSQQPLQSNNRLRTVRDGSPAEDDDEDANGDERAPLLSASSRMRSEPAMAFQGFGSTDNRKDRPTSHRESSRASGRKDFRNPPFTPGGAERYDVNYPPSMPGSPRLGGLERDLRFEDAMLMDELSTPHHEGSFMDELLGSPTSPQGPSSPYERRHTFSFQAGGDVCFPQEGMSELADDEVREMREQRARTRRRKKRWPVLSVLDEWSRLEKEGRNEERRTKTITEPQLVNGRLRPVHKGWFQPEEDAPYRFTYFNEEFDSTIHSSTISELVQAEGQGANFRELFVPDRPILDDSSESESEDDDTQQQATIMRRALSGQNGESKVPTRQPSVAASVVGSSDATRDGALSPKTTQEGQRNPRQTSGDATPSQPRSVTSAPQINELKPVRYGERPVWWLDIMCPTDAEMLVLRRAFGIHPLTVEDIMLQEAREKVELFHNYYFINYRTFNQDATSEDHLEPVNFYVIVFREGVLSFHFSPTPHSANVRRRIRMLRDFMVLSSDWISYAIIDDITDVYGPLIQNIEEEVDEIDAAIVRLHSEEDPTSKEKLKGEKSHHDASKSEAGATTFDSGGDMYRRVGECRKKVMGLYRLLGNKADVIKGFAKRCNEHWEVAPRSEIGLFLGDIQDHIVTMTGNLSHYEMILARSHQNYLAQINIRMNERAEQTADVLGKLTVLGTIVLPMNIITGLWGMNVWVPGQDYEDDLTWFWCITGGLVLFGLGCYITAKRVYRIV
ncbi:CorA metal ion transporter [Diaporthe australafricana]|uniref:CorA metal ion transporter n=1 Tax=Diaporthe australafricana TaxID=127596 RepID=A0ABR3XSZ0_9PEZI